MNCGTNHRLFFQAAKSYRAAQVVEKERERILLLIHGNPLAALPRGLAYEIDRQQKLRELVGNDPAFCGLIDDRTKGPPAAGRNERCPCGSGKKFKRCCRGK